MPNPITNFKDSSGVDFGNILITKEYLMSVYPNIAQEIGKTPELWTWGNGSYGQLGNASTVNVSTPITTFAGAANWKQLSSGASHAAAIKTDGTLWVWGNNGSGRLGNASTVNVSTPITTSTGGTNWKQVSSGGNHTVAIKTDGNLWVWGNNSNGQLGNASTTDRSTPSMILLGSNNFKQIHSGSAIGNDGTLWLWGSNSSGQLGNASTVTSLTPVTTSIGGTNWKQVSSSTHTVAVKTDGTLWVWGNNSNGQLGNASTTDRSTPVTTFAGGTNWRQVANASWGTVALKTDGTVWTWGSTFSGNLGIGFTNGIRSTPVTMFLGGTNWKHVTAGFGGAGVKTDGTLWSWGYGFGGNHGNAVTGFPIDRSTPVTTFTGGTNWRVVNRNSGATAAIKTDGTLWTWGNNSSGQLGNATTVLAGGIATPTTTFSGGTNWRQAVITNTNCIALKSDGTLWVWGADNGSNGTNQSSGTRISTPTTTFAGGTNWLDTATGAAEEHYTIFLNSALKTDGTLWVWGGNTANNSGATKLTPVTVFLGGNDWKQVSSGGTHTVGIKIDGSLWTWGNNSRGQLGNASTVNVSIPITTFIGGTNWKQISSGYFYASAIKTDGTLWTWGYNSKGQLGNASTVNSSTPVTTFIGGTNWKQVSSGNAHTAAIKTDGTLWTWGNNNAAGFTAIGQLGNASTVNASTPVTTFAGGTNWKQVSSGGSHTSAIKTDGTLWVWGNSNNGTLGNSLTVNSSTPVTTFVGGTNWKLVSGGTNYMTAIKSADFI